MSGRYGPGNGQNFSRNFGESRRNTNVPRGNNSKSRYGPRESYPPSGPKKYRERDNYRSGSELGGRSEAFGSNYRPTGPSGYKNDSRDYYHGVGSKRSFAHDNKGSKGSGEPYRKRQDTKDYVSHSWEGGPRYKNMRGSYPSSNIEGNKGRSIDTKNFPKGPRFSTMLEARGGRRKTPPPAKVPPYKRTPSPPVARLAKSQIYLITVKRSGPVYDIVQQVGEGTYGKVYKARNNITAEHVALKKLRLETEREGFPITAMREIKLLQSFNHENVVGLLEMMVERNHVYMVFDYMDHDLTGLLTNSELKLTESHRKFIFKQLMEGLNYLHLKRVIHRDIKGSNILIDSIGRLKIADFGLARRMSALSEGEIPDYTNRVITIWYRPPELLLGSTDYGREVDIWGLGCLLIELYSNIAAFQGFDEVGQLHKIFNILGTPSIEDWPDMENLPWFEMLKPKVNKASIFAKEYQHIMSEQSFDLAQKLLTLNPKKRLTASLALEHPYFTQEPFPEPLYFLKDVQGEWHEFETKRKRRKERKRLQEAKNASSLSIARSNVDSLPQSLSDLAIPPDGPKQSS